MIVPVVNCTMPGKNKDKTLIKTTTTTTAISHAIHMHLNIVYQSQYNFVYAGFMSNIYHEGDKLVIIHSHELHPPVMPRKCKSLR